MASTDELHFTEDTEANRLLADEPLALLIGLALYQQVPVEKAFSGPHVLRERLGGSLDAPSIAAMPLDDLEEIFKETPAIHRFPGSMAKRIHALAIHISDEYDGDAAGPWREATATSEVKSRLKKLPGFGDYKVTVAFTVLAKRLGVQPEGWEDAMADFPTVADIDGPGQLEEFKARKKAWKET